ncbi:citrate synthase [Periconia macrospinosa]|uniref:Citrate synthase n=1 Tax=Periconia macrospinosa TaxID=97972 RepID=A0A2V1DXA1_9PLEO|nr:citrate synthase [Periconia macrospinosa]
MESAFIMFLNSFLSLFHVIFHNLFQLPSLNKLWILDWRTFRWYKIPIDQGAIRATEFRRISPLSIAANYKDHIAKGLTVLDPGFRNTAVIESRITHVDGDRGALQFRQYPIGHLFAHHDYEDVTHLLVWGEIPTPDQKLKFRGQIAKRMIPHQSVINAIQAFDPDAPAFLIVAAGLSAWAASQPLTIPSNVGNTIYEKSSNAVDDGIYRSLAAFTTVVALTYCRQQGRPIHQNVDASLSSIENMVLMMGRVDENGRPDTRVVRAFNKLWILFADHEMTNSTSAFLNAASTLGDPISALVASVASGNGPLHGGAIDIAYKRFKQMHNKEGVRLHLADVRDKKCRLMGVGHRVYRTVDPRIQYIKAIMADLEVNTECNPLLEVALEIDRVVATDPYFTQRRLCINADLYGSFVYAALGFDPRIFTPFAMTARCAGALAHWRESLDQSPCLWRPKQVFTGKVM